MLARFRCSRVGSAAGQHGAMTARSTSPSERDEHLENSSVRTRVVAGRERRNAASSASAWCCGGRARSAATRRKACARRDPFAQVGDGLALGSSRGRIALAATVAGSGMASLDATVVNVALRHIGNEFDASVSALQWVLTGYLLALASLILLGGALGDHYGRRKVFVIGTIWFAGASLLCGAAPNIEVLIGARVLQGVGAALLTPGSLAILQASFRAHAGSARIGHGWRTGIVGWSVGAVDPAVEDAARRDS